MAGPILGIDFLKQFNVNVAPGSNKILFATNHGATCPNRCDRGKNPFTAAAQLKGNPGISPTNANSKTRSLLDPPPAVLPATQPIPASVPADVRALLEKYPSILRTGDVVPKPTHGVEHHIHTGGHPPFLQKPAVLSLQNLTLPRKNFKNLRQPA